MIVRVMNFLVIGVLVLAAAYVYRVKFDATVQAERLAKLRSELRHERDKVAALRAEWEQLDNPDRIETLAKRFLPLQPIAPTQFDTIDRLPDRSAQDVATRTDPIGGMIENLEQTGATHTTGTLPPPPATTRPAGPADRSPAGARQ